MVSFSEMKYRVFRCTLAVEPTLGSCQGEYIVVRCVIQAKSGFNVRQIGGYIGPKSYQSLAECFCAMQRLLSNPAREAELTMRLDHLNICLTQTYLPTLWCCRFWNALIGTRTVVSYQAADMAPTHCTMCGTRLSNVGLIVAWRPASPLGQILPQSESHLPQTQILGIVALRLQTVLVTASTLVG